MALLCGIVGFRVRFLRILLMRRLYGQRQRLLGETRLPKAIGELGGVRGVFKRQST